MAHDPGFGGSIGTEPAISRAEIIDLAFKYDTKEMTKYVQEHEPAKKYLRRVLHGEDFEDAEEVVAPPKPTTTTRTTTTTTDIGKKLAEDVKGMTEIMTGTGPGTISHFIETFNPFKPYVDVSREKLEEERKAREYQQSLQKYGQEAYQLKSQILKKIHNLAWYPHKGYNYTETQLKFDLSKFDDIAREARSEYFSIPMKYRPTAAGYFNSQRAKEIKQELENEYRKQLAYLKAAEREQKEIQVISEILHEEYGEEIAERLGEENGTPTELPLDKELTVTGDTELL